MKNLHYYRHTLGWKGVASVCKAKILRSTVLLQMNRRSGDAPIYLRVPSADIKVYEKVFLNEEYRTDVVSSPKTIVDAGAHIGLTSIYFATRFPEARIIAIEPERQNFELLKRNVSSFKTIIPVQAALWSDTHELSLWDPAGGSWGFMTGDEHDPKHKTMSFRHTVRGITVSNLIDEFRLDRIDILKLDIEGAERELFRKAELWLDKVDAVIVELHDRLKPGCTDAFHQSTKGFGREWTQGENIFLSRPTGVLKRGKPD